MEYRITDKAGVIYEVWKVGGSVWEVVKRLPDRPSQNETVFIAASLQECILFTQSKLLRCAFCMDNNNLKIYDGALGYEAAYCPRCGYFEDHQTVGKDDCYIGR